MDPTPGSACSRSYLNKNAIHEREREIERERKRDINIYTYKTSLKADKEVGG